MHYIEAPEFIKLPIDSFEFPPSVFLGGGITNCRNWQKEVCEYLKDTNLVILNPRRDHYPDHSNTGLEQITWEFNHMNFAKSIMFWFSKETLCPITLFEYGKWITRSKKLFVGCDPEYARRYDLTVQTQLERPHQKIHTDLKSLTDEIIDWMT